MTESKEIITLTSAAKNRIKEIITKAEKNYIGIRIGIDNTGCSGHSYKINYAENKIGSLEVGKYADFAVIDKDFLSGPDTEIRDNKVLMTVLAGETRYKDADFNPLER